eukprot:13528077-Alexandrium_andersonii.AAC.1
MTRSHFPYHDHRPGATVLAATSHCARKHPAGCGCGGRRVMESCGHELGGPSSHSDGLGLVTGLQDSQSPGHGH